MLQKSKNRLDVINGANDTQIEMYLEDIFAFSDRELYEGIEDEAILADFDTWLEE